MRRLCILIGVIYAWTAPAMAQAPVELEFFKSLWGVSITAALLALMVYLYIRSQIKRGDTAEGKLDKAQADKELLVREGFTMARDMKDSFNSAIASDKEGRDEVRRLHGETQARLDVILARLTAIESKLDSNLAVNRRP